jgi:hypothetical protein
MCAHKLENGAWKNGGQVRGCSVNRSDVFVRLRVWIGAWLVCVPTMSACTRSDRQTDRQSGRQAGRQTGKQTDREACRQAGMQADRQTGRQAGLP